MKILQALTLCALLSSMAANAGNAWYVGKVSRVALFDSEGSFVVTFKNGALGDCMHKYAYFYHSKLGEGRLKHAYSMALASLTADLNMGIVINKELNGVGGQCNADGMTADLRAK